MQIPKLSTYGADTALAREIDDFLDGDPKRLANKYLPRYESESMSIGKEGPGSTISESNPLVTLDFGTRNFERRKASATYVNHSEQILQIHLGATARNMQVFGASAESWDAILEDLTGFDMGKNEVLQELLALYFSHGRCGLLADAPSEVSTSTIESQINNERPYFSLFSIYNIWNYSVFNSGPMKGKFKEVVLREPDENGKVVVKQLFIDQVGQPFKFNILSGEKEDALSIIDSGTGSLTEIPFVLFGAGRKDCFLKNVKNLSKRRFVETSSLENILHHQAFQKVHFSGMENMGEVKALSENTISWSKNASSSIHTIPPVNPTALESLIKNLDRMINKVGLLQRHSLSDDSNESPSAESKQRDNETLFEFYNKVLSMFEKKLSKAFNYLSALQDLDDNISVKISRDYLAFDSEKDLLERQFVNSQAISLGATEIQKQILRIGVSNLKLIPSETQTEDEIRKSLLESLEQPTSLTSVRRPLLNITNE